MNRRNFLAAAAAAAFAPAMFVRAAETKRKVVVVGGGLAGLSCAYELRKLCFEAIVLEGQGRAGGRVQTLREDLDWGLSAETVLSSGQDISADAEAVLEGEGVERVCEYRSGVGEILGAWAGVAGGARPPAVVCHWRERGKARHDGCA